MENLITDDRILKVTFYLPNGVLERYVGSVIPDTALKITGIQETVTKDVILHLSNGGSQTFVNIPYVLDVHVISTVLPR